MIAARLPLALVCLVGLAAGACDDDDDLKRPDPGQQGRADGGGAGGGGAGGGGAGGGGAGGGGAGGGGAGGGGAGGGGAGGGGAGGGGEGGGGAGGGGAGGGGAGGEVVILPDEGIGDYAARTCFSRGDPTPPQLLAGLSAQLVDAINCLRPDTLAELPAGNWQLLDPIRRALIDARGVDDLLNAAAARDTPLVIRWAYRDVAVQHLFYLWTQKGCDFAAPPGLSNHQNGLSVDLNDPGAWSPHMRAFGWFDQLPTDRPHFDYTLAEDEGLATLSLFAFQALHTLNRPDDPLPLTGEFDAQTENALSAAPIEGFVTGLCETGPPPPLPALRGPSVAQSAWRGCDIPIALIEGLAQEVAEVARCADPTRLVPLRLCAEAGCLSVAGPPKPEFLGAEAHDALLAASRALGRPLPIAWGLRDPALTWYLFSTQGNLSCPGDVAAPSVSPYVTGRAAVVPEADDPAVLAALQAEGFVPVPEGEGWQLEDADDLRPLLVYAFQELWNHNRPEDAIPTDGRLTPATLDALSRAPIFGFGDRPCEGLDPPAPGEVTGYTCVGACFNQTCPGTYDFCTEQFGACAAVPCADDGACDGLATCDDPARGSSPIFYCDAGQCRRRR